MTRFRFIAISLAATMLAAFATSLALAHGGDQEKIHSCLDKHGNIRVIAAQASCEKDETPLDWNIQGQSGAAGAAGATGATGPKGDRGDVGASGAASLPGERAIGFAKITGIDGDSDVRGHEHEIIITGFKAGATLAVSSHSGGGSGAGRADFADLTITKMIDRASPKLFDTLATGRHIQEVVVDITRPDRGDTAVTFKYRLQDVLVTAVTTSSSGRAGEEPLEAVSFNFERITVTYHSGTTTVESCFDVAANNDC